MIQLEQAFQALDQGDLKTAEVGFRGVLQKDPANGKACWGLARVATLTGQKDVAIKLYAHCCRCLPGEPEPLIALGEALSARNRFIEAKVAFTEAVEANSIERRSPKSAIRIGPPVRQRNLTASIRYLSPFQFPINSRS